VVWFFNYYSSQLYQRATLLESLTVVACSCMDSQKGIRLGRCGPKGGTSIKPRRCCRSLSPTFAIFRFPLIPHNWVTDSNWGCEGIDVASDSCQVHLPRPVLWELKTLSFVLLYYTATCVTVNAFVRTPSSGNELCTPELSASISKAPQSI
jgi:hypothetical protein